MKIAKCFWCGYTKEMTLEHIIPKACGGGEQDENKTHACEECNTERGQIPGFRCSIVDFSKYLENWDETNLSRVKRAQKMYKQLKKTQPKMLEMQSKWKKIEEVRLGTSPTAEIDLQIPEVPGPTTHEADPTTDLIKKYFKLREEARQGNQAARQEIIQIALDNNLNAGCIL